MQKTKILSLESLSEKELKEYFSRYPVAIPTETVYGLASVMSNKKTTALIYEIKNRPSVNPLILHISNLNMLEKLIEFMPECYKPVIEKLWPGPLSLLFKASEYTKQYIDLEFICIRMPSNKIALSIINKLNEPLFAPSANLSGKISPTSSKHVLDDLNNRIELIIEGGQSMYGLESTIFDFRTMKVLRPGHISEEEINDISKNNMGSTTSENREDENIKTKLNSQEEIICPGTKFKHYSPENDLILFKTKEELSSNLENLRKLRRFFRISILYANKEYLNIDILKTYDKYGKDCAFKDYSCKKEITENIIILFDLGKDFQEISYNFYDFLRTADKNSDIIFCESFENDEGAIAIMDRMNRAAQK